MRQEVSDDPRELEDWDRRDGSRSFVYIANALVWREITGERPPTTPSTAKAYTDPKLLWFDYYYATDQKPLEGSERLTNMNSVLGAATQRRLISLPENASVEGGSGR